MAGVLSKAVTDLRQELTTVVEIKVDGTAYRLTPRLCARARAEAEEGDAGEPLPHNTARRVFISAVVRELNRDDPELAVAPAVRGVLDALWPEAEPRQLLARLYQEPGLLDLADDERAAIARDAPGPWTPADVPLLDELAELLGPVEATELAATRERASDEAERAETLQYAAQLVKQLVADGAIVRRACSGRGPARG
jgi:hypothetical protein